MQVTERRPELSVVDSDTTPLSPEVLFDLLADPRGCLTWHEHPGGIDVQSVEGPPGLALAGAEFEMRGGTRGLTWTSKTLVTAADRPSSYAYTSTMRVEHPGIPDLISSERYFIERTSGGSVVRYVNDISRDRSKGSWLYKLVIKINDALFARSRLRRCFRDQLRAAERHAGLHA